MRAYRQKTTNHIFLVTSNGCWRLFQRHNVRGVLEVTRYNPNGFIVEQDFTPVTLTVLWQEFRSELEFLHREGAI